MRLRFRSRNNPHQYSSSLDEDAIMNSRSVHPSSLQQDQFDKDLMENNTDMEVQEGARRSTYESSRRWDNAEILQTDGEDHVSLPQDAVVQKWSEDEKMMPLKKRKIPKTISEEDEKENYNSQVKSHKSNYMHDGTRSSVDSLLQELPKVSTPMNLISRADDHFNKVEEDCGVEHEKPINGGATIQTTFKEERYEVPKVEEVYEEKPILMLDSEEKETHDIFKNIPKRKRSNMNEERHRNHDIRRSGVTVRGWRCTKNEKKGSSTLCTYHLEKQENHSEQEASPAEKSEMQVRKVPKFRSMKFLLEQTARIQ